MTFFRNFLRILGIILFLNLAFFALTSCSPAVKVGDTVKVSYWGTFDDGTIFDSSEKNGKTFEFTLGKKQVLPAFEKTVEGMKVGETKKITLAPAEGYGEYKKELVHAFPVTSFSRKIQPGELVNIVDEQGREKVARALLVANNAILVDANHPLAGKTLHFEITLEEIVVK